MLRSNKILIFFALVQCNSPDIFYDGAVGLQGGYAGYALFNRVVCCGCENFIFFDSNRYPDEPLENAFLAGISFSLFSTYKCTPKSDFGSFMNLMIGKGYSGSSGIAFRRNASKCFIRGSFGVALEGASFNKTMDKTNHPLIRIAIGARLAIEFAYYLQKHIYASVSLIGVIGKGRSLSVACNLGVTSKPCLV